MAGSKCSSPRWRSWKLMSVVPTSRWPSINMLGSPSASPSARICSPISADLSSCARNRYRLARPRSTENCSPTSTPRSNRSRALEKAASTSGVKPLVAIRARASVVRSAISWLIRSVEVGTASRTASMSEASPTVSRYQPWASSRIEQRLGQPVQLLEVARVHPEGPGDAQVRDSAANRSRATSRPAPPRSPRSRPASAA